MARSQPAYIDLDVVLATGAGGWRNDDATYADFLHVTNIGGQYAAVNAAIVGTSLAVHGMEPRAAGPVMLGKGTNLFPSPYSVNNASWSKFDMVVTAGQEDAEYGGTAQNVRVNDTTSKHRRILPASPSITISTGVYELEMDLAYLGYQWLQFELSGASCFQALDVLNGAFGIRSTVRP